MAKYTSRYAELSFYVDGKERKFSAGVYDARTKEEIAVLDQLVDVVRAEDTTAELTEEPQKPAPKPRTKAGANASGK